MQENLTQIPLMAVHEAIHVFILCNFFICIMAVSSFNYHFRPHSFISLFDSVPLPFA
jgi:hypothetical protein